MASTITTITHDKLARLIGTPKCPLVLDVRTDEDFAGDPRNLPGALRRGHADVVAWARDLKGRTVVVACRSGRELSHGVAAMLRHEGIPAEVLEGGYEAWKAAGWPLVPEAKLPVRDGQGRTAWVTRARPKVDRIACPWLIRRFVDPSAIFLFVQPSEVEAVGERFGAAPFDVENVFWSHRGERCTFDTMLDELGLATPPLLRELIQSITLYREDDQHLLIKVEDSLAPYLTCRNSSSPGVRDGADGIGKGTGQ